jgi:hypothetical protein
MGKRGVSGLNIDAHECSLRPGAFTRRPRKQELTLIDDD